MPQPQDKDPLSAGAKLNGSSSVAHQIIDAFLVSLEQAEGYADISKNLRKAMFDKKPTEASLRSALFGDDVL
jgi:hypothetical protein